VQARVCPWGRRASCDVGPLVRTQDAFLQRRSIYGTHSSALDLNGKRSPVLYRRQVGEPLLLKPSDNENPSTGSAAGGPLCYPIRAVGAARPRPLPPAGQEPAGLLIRSCVVAYHTPLILSTGYAAAPRAPAKSEEGASPMRPAY
jgi:hypothetical protein